MISFARQGGTARGWVATMAAGLRDIAHRADRVYVTTDRELVKIWAGQWTDDAGRVGYGWLYRVGVDVDALEPDEDLLSLPGLSYQAPTAIVSSIYARAVARISLLIAEEQPDLDADARSTARQRCQVRGCQLLSVE